MLGSILQSPESNLEWLFPQPPLQLQHRKRAKIRVTTNGESRKSHDSTDYYFFSWTRNSGSSPQKRGAAHISHGTSCLHCAKGREKKIQLKFFHVRVGVHAKFVEIFLFLFPFLFGLIMYFVILLFTREQQVVPAHVQGRIDDDDLLSGDSIKGPWDKASIEEVFFFFFFSSGRAFYSIYCVGEFSIVVKHAIHKSYS